MRNKKIMNIISVVINGFFLFRHRPYQGYVSKVSKMGELKHFSHHSSTNQIAVFN